LVVLFACAAKEAGEPGPPVPGPNDSPPVDSPADGNTSPPDASGSRGDASDASVADAPPAHDPTGPFWRQSAVSGDLAKFALDEASPASDGALEIKAGGGHAGTDPYPAGGWHGRDYYNGGAYTFAVATSPEHVFAAPFTTATVSFEATTPPGTWVSFKVSARVAGQWTKAYDVGVWAFEKYTVARHSVDGQKDADGDVATDTLVLSKPGDALKITALLFSATSGVTPRVRAVSAVATNPYASPPTDAPDKSVWGKVLAVPKRSQMIYPNGGEVWCSPTSTSMLLAYWSSTLSKSDLLEPVPTAADHCFDWLYNGTGNWPFNTAHGAAMGGGALHGIVTRLFSFAQVERLVRADVPVAISVAYGAGELHGSPVASTNGHLIVVRGFAANGDVVCNDPAFPSDAEVEVTYDRAELTKAWSHSAGTAYVLWPASDTLPVDPLGAFY
jgi:hypothetical protein